MTRTVLEIAQDAAPALGVAAPEVLFGSTDTTETTIRVILNRVAVRMAKAHEWPALRSVETVSGDGSTTAFDLPADYDRMPKDAHLWSDRLERALTPAEGDDWRREQVRAFNRVNTLWTILGGQMQFLPAPSSGESIYYDYMTANVATGKSRFDDDADVFLLNDETLELGLIAQWRKSKGLDYEDEERDYMAALSHDIAAAKGARIITQRTRRGFAGAVTAYPWSIE